MNRTEFCEAFEWKIPIRWYGITGLHQMDPITIAKVSLHDPITSGSYTGFRVKIIRKDVGLIDDLVVSFNDFLPPPVPGVTGSQYLALAPDAFRGSQVDWHVHKPTSTEAICRAVEEYINTYKIL